MSAPSAPSAARVERSFLSFDYGLRRVGVASGNTLLGQARPLRTLSSEGQARIDEIAALVAQWQPDALVVGVPFHPDGAPHENTARARRFARQLAGRLGLPVHEVDERYSTVEVLSEGARDVDAAAAAVILQQFLDAQARPSSAHDGAPGEDRPDSLEEHPLDPPSLEHRL